MTIRNRLVTFFYLLTRGAPVEICGESTQLNGLSWGTVNGLIKSLPAAEIVPVFTSKGGEALARELVDNLIGAEDVFDRDRVTALVWQVAEAYGADRSASCCQKVVSHIDKHGEHVYTCTHTPNRGALESTVNSLLAIVRPFDDVRSEDSRELIGLITGVLTRFRPSMSPSSELTAPDQPKSEQT